MAIVPKKFFIDQLSQGSCDPEGPGHDFQLVQKRLLPLTRSRYTDIYYINMFMLLVIESICPERSTQFQLMVLPYTNKLYSVSSVEIDDTVIGIRTQNTVSLVVDRCQAVSETVQPLRS